MDKQMTVTISRLYDDYASASRAVTELEAAGIPHSDISIIAGNSDNWYAADMTGSRTTTTRSAPNQTTAKVDRDRDGVDDRAEGAAAGGGIGAAIGGAAGLLTGLGLMAIPGVGPVVAAGWLVATLAGAAAGGLAGSLVGALTQAGVSEQDANVYAEGVRRGGTLVTARVPDADRARCETILNRASINIRDREAAYRKSGWSSFDSSASPYTADETMRERNSYRDRGAA
jgi:hypothetical protein